MKEAVVDKGPTVRIQDSAIPKPGKAQLLIKVVFSGSNPKDWKIPEWTGKVLNQGDDISGVVHEVGEGVTEFKPGDRVAAFHEMQAPGGSYAEYALAWAHTTFLLPPNTSFQQGAAIPLAALTAALGLYGADRLDLPQPWSPAAEPIPLVVYGASSAVGSYAVQLAQRSNIHPLICVAGRAQEHVQKLISPDRGDIIVDYRNGDQAVAQGIKDALKGQTLHYAYDAVSEKGSYQNICKVLEPQGKITLVLPGRRYPEIPETVKQSITSVGDVHGKNKDLGYVFSRYIFRGLEEEWFKPQPQEIVPGGLEGIQQALEKLKDGTASAVKYVFRIADTPAVSS
ncbi:GroES-like protein [Polychaeton citri CBS 116435]|uniref:GroES-like protein n=1 Tax=Polychaeton citri CBS 116435 TaxID=1314669 RepID=A0A9P4UPM9_9PEZI|nr:GroES-like protein [Polychaeton citri CBS 116435]